MRRVCGLAWLLALAVGLVAARAPAASLYFDPALSAITPAAGPAQSLSGTITILLGAEPPLASNTSFELTGLAIVSSGGTNIGLDPALSHPGAGVLAPSGSFLIPTLFLRLVDGTTVVDLSVPNVSGFYGSIPGCPLSACLESSFAIDTGGPAGVVDVHVVAVPEPATLALFAGALISLAAARRAGAGVAR